MISRLRFAAGLLLLAAASYSVWQTIGILSARRTVREDLAEINHVRYGLLNADVWVDKIVPVLNARIDALDLTAADRNSLRPMAISALNRLLDQVKDQLIPKPAPGAGPSGFAALAQAAIITNLMAGLKPHIPEYADMVLRELTNPQSKKAIRDYIRGIVADGAKATFGTADKQRYNGILKQYGCADDAACRSELSHRIQELDSRAALHYRLALAATALAFLLLSIGRAAIALQLLFCIALLLGGILTPMIEVEAKISKVSLTFLGQPISFPDQVLYYQSKSVLEVFHTLLTMGQPEMVIVAVLVLLFSVVFPILKIISTALCLGNPSLQKFRLIRFFALESSKWSMADVMALAIFMSFVAFNGVIGSAMNTLKNPAMDVVLPTDSSRTLPGFYLFIGFCLASLWLAKKMDRSLSRIRGEQNEIV